MGRAFPLKPLIAALSGVMPREADWEGLLAAANETLTTGTLAERPLPNQGELPDDVRQILLEVHKRILERNARMREQLAEAVSQLNRAGIHPLLLKGTAIQSMVNVASNSRILSDLDLMVPPESLAGSLSALEDLGYRCEPRSEDPRFPVVLSRTQDVGPIDLHHQAYSEYPTLSREELMRDATRVSIGKGSAYLPSPTMQMAVLVAHDQLHDRDYWRGSIDLRHLLDSATLAGSHQGIDWRQLDEIFSEGYLKRALRTHLLTLHNLLGTPVPQELLSGRRASIQYLRRVAQARFPALLIPATALSIVIDPPWQLARRVATRAHKRLKNREYSTIYSRGLSFISHVVRKYFGSRRSGKA